MNMINISVAGGVPSPVEGACGALTIGNVGDNGATGVALDFSAWAEEYGTGAVTLGVRRKGDAAWYPVALTVTDAEAVWIVSNIDTAVYGIGEARFDYTVSEVEKRSAVFRFFVDRGLGAPEGTPPDPYEDWVERLEDLGAETLQNAQDAADSASEAAGSAEDAADAKDAAEAAQGAAETSQTGAETAAGHAADSAEDAEAWAVGKRGGVDVPSTDPAYHNNAKYWAEQAVTEAPVKSVNGQTGEVTLDAEDVGALPDSSTLDDIQDGTTYKRTTEAQLEQIAENANDIDALQGDVESIESKIPNAASAQNQLADKQFVTDSITQGTAIYRGSYASRAALLAVAWQTTDPDAANYVSNNDYAYVLDDETQDDECWRYLYVTGSGWTAQVRINESPLTQAQLDALNSGATAAKIDAIAGKLGTSGDGSNVTATFSAASSRTNICTGEKLSVIFGKIAKWFSDLGSAAFRAATNAITQGSTDLIESGAVYTALAGKLSTSTKYAASASVGGPADKTVSIPMGAVDSTSTDTAFTASVGGITELRDGVLVWLTNGVVTSAAGCTLDINGLGAKPIYNSIAAATATTTMFNINYTMLFVFNSTRVTGGCWDMVYGYDSNTTYTPVKLGFGYATCSTAAATAAKTASLSSYTLTVNGLVAVKFSYDVPASATLNINSKGAKAIYYKDAAITAGVIKGGDTALFVYSTYYRLLAIDHWGTDITSILTALDNKQAKINASGILKGDGAGGVSAATAGTDYGTYSKPSGGIPKTDLASGVQTSLGKADTALQSVPNTYRTASAQDLIDAAQNAAIADAQPYNVNVTVSPLDYSCVMDKTIAEIDAAVRGGRTIRLVAVVAGGYGEAFNSAAVYETSPDVTYGSLNALGIFNTGGVESWVSLTSGTTDDGTHNTMRIDTNPFDIPSSPSDIGAQVPVVSTTVSAAGVISYKDSGGNTLFTVQLPLYTGGVT